MRRCVDSRRHMDEVQSETRTHCRGTLHSDQLIWHPARGTRIELREKGIHVIGLHVGFMDTDMTRGYDLKKTSPRDVAFYTLVSLETGKDEVLVDENTRRIKQSLSGEHAYYLNVPALA